jgi:hypothetical protein
VTFDPRGLRFGAESQVVKLLKGLRRHSGHDELIEPRVQTIKAKQDIWTGGPESLGASWMTETGEHPELCAFFPIGDLMELACKFASSLHISEK